MDHARAQEQTHTSQPAPSLHSPCVSSPAPIHEHNVFCSPWTRTDAALVHHCHPLFCFYSPCPALFPLSILFSLALYQSFLLSGSKDVRHSSVWSVLPSPLCLTSPPSFPALPFHRGGGEGGVFFLLLFFFVYVALLK